MSAISKSNTPLKLPPPSPESSSSSLSSSPASSSSSSSSRILRCRSLSMKITHITLFCAAKLPLPSANYRRPLGWLPRSSTFDDDNRYLARVCVVTCCVLSPASPTLYHTVSALLHGVFAQSCDLDILAMKAFIRGGRSHLLPRVS